MITHSLIISVLESYAMAVRQVRWLAQLLPENWELIFNDDGSKPEIPFPDNWSRRFQFIRTDCGRKPGEWTQHEAINLMARVARGKYLVKSDIDHIFTPAAIAAADRFEGDMMLFDRRAGVLTEGLQIEPLDHEVSSPVDDIYVIRRDLFLSLGGYPEPVTRRYGGAGKCFWGYSRKPEAQPPDGALIYVTPGTHEKYHSLERVEAYA